MIWFLNPMESTTVFLNPFIFLRICWQMNWFRFLNLWKDYFTPHNFTLKLLGKMPQPLSTTWNQSLPKSLRAISTAVPPASRLVSTSSLIAEERSRMTSLASIRCTMDFLMGSMTCGSTAIDDYKEQCSWWWSCKGGLMVEMELLVG